MFYCMHLHNGIVVLYPCLLVLRLQFSFLNYSHCVRLFWEIKDKRKLGNKHDRSQWAQTEAQEVPSRHQAAPLCCVSNRALAQAAQGGYRVSSLEAFKSLLEMGLGSFCLSRGWTRYPPQVPSSLS